MTTQRPMRIVFRPEPLGCAISGGWLKKVLAGRKAAIKPMLLDQRIIAGLGNIYVCEALFRARINPKRAAGRVSRAKLDALKAGWSAGRSDKTQVLVRFQVHQLTVSDGRV